jgi:hypothetical protein
MAVGNLRVSSRMCATCGTVRKFEKNAMVWGCGDLLLVVVTFGIWIIIRYVADLMVNPWRCSVCGTRA